MAWNSGQSLKGQRGAQILFGARDPRPSDGFDGDGWVNSSTGKLFAQKANGSWPTTYATLAAVGNVFYSGTDQPGSTTPGNPGDLFFRTTTATFYQQTANGWASLGSVAGTNGTNGSQITFTNAPPGATYGAVGDFAYYPTTQTFYSKTSTGWATLGSVTGAQGPKGDTGAASTVAGPKGDTGAAGTPGSNGLSVVSGTAAPTASDGVTGSPAFINTAAGTLYGAKTGSGWPTSFLSLVGSKGDPGATGPASPGLYSGSGVPTSTNPSGTQVVGSYYLRTDVTPALLYGPLSASGWPSTAQNTGGSQTQYGYGPPASSLGAQGDVYYDLNGLFYPPKTSSGWTLTPINQVGPTGAPGYTTLSTQSAGNGPSVGMSGVTLSSTAAAAYIPGSSQPNSYTAVAAASELAGYSITNPGSAVTVSLYNTTTSTTLASFNISANITTGDKFALGTYPMPANNNFQWRASGSGTANFCLTPLYLYPAASVGNNVSSCPTVGISSSTTFSSTATQLKYPGTSTGNAYRLAKAGALYAANLANLTNASLTFTLNISTNSGNSYSALYSVSVAANTTMPVGAFSSGQYPAASGAFIYWTAAGTGTGTCFADTQILLVG